MLLLLLLRRKSALVLALQERRMHRMLLLLLLLTGSKLGRRGLLEKTGGMRRSKVKKNRGSEFTPALIKKAPHFLFLLPLSLFPLARIEMAPPPRASTLTQPLARSNGESDKKPRGKHAD